MIRASSPMRNSAGQTRLPTFSMISRSISSSGSDGSAERTMFASRWHSPPKPLSVLSCVDRDVQVREPVGVQRALHVALEHADAHAVERRRAGMRSSSVVLPAPGRAHQVDDRDAVAVEVVAVGPRDRVVGVERVLDDPDLHAMHARPPRTSIDSTSSSSPATHLDVGAAARRAAERRAARSPTRARTPSQRSRAGTTSCSSRAPSQTRLARDDPEVELQRVRHDLAQAPDAQRARPSPAARRRGARRCRRPRWRPRARASGLVRRVRAQLGDRLAHERRARGRRPPRPAASGRARRPRPRPARSRSTTTLPEPAADRADEAQHRLRVHPVRVDRSRRPRSSAANSSRSGSIT